LSVLQIAKGSIAMIPPDVIAAALFCRIGYEAGAPKLLPPSHRTNIIHLLSLPGVVNTNLFGAFIGAGYLHVHIAAIVQGLVGGFLLRCLSILRNFEKNVEATAVSWSSLAPDDRVLK
jgi:hypothetical protein